MQKLFIKNRKGQKVAVIMEEAKPQKGLAFVMHGLGGFKEQPHVAIHGQAFSEKGYTVVRFDATHSYGESEGKFEDVTTTKSYEDLMDVIAWAKGQLWYREPFCLSGHSFGGMCVALYAEEHPTEVKALSSTSLVISRKLWWEAFPEKLRNEWEQTGWRVWPSITKPGLMKRLKYTFITDGFLYDLLSGVDRLTMPVLMIVGENDTETPLQHQKLLFEKLSGKKELHIIHGAFHTFREENFSEVKEIFSKWIETLN